MENPREKRCVLALWEEWFMWQPSVGKRMPRWNSTGPGRAKERPKVAGKVNGEIRVRGLGVSPAGKEKATLEGHRKERTGLTRPIARRRMMMEHGHFRWRPEQHRTSSPKSGRHHQVCHHPSQRHPRDAFRDSETEHDDEELTMKVGMVKLLKRRKPHMPRSTFISKSQARKKAEADSMLVDQSIK